MEENRQDERQGGIGQRPERRYPCDMEAPRRSYPIDREPERKYGDPIGQRPKDRQFGAGEDFEGTEAGRNQPKSPAGKGRRGGNSSLSFVKRSEKPRTEEKESGEGGRRFSGSARREFPKRNDAADRRGGFSDRRYGASSAGRGGAYGSERRRNMADRRDRTRDLPEFVDDFNTPKHLRVLQNTEIGSFLSLSDGQKVLLPFAEQTEQPAVGETVSVYLYQDKGGRLTATMRTPHLRDNELGILKVSDVTRIGLFLDNGVPKELLVPFREQICTPKQGRDVLVRVYRDKSGRQAATMRVYQHLENKAPYEKDDQVTGFVYEINPDIGVFVAVDGKYFGLIPKSEVFEPYCYGMSVSCRVLRVREDGKLDLSGREKSYVSIEKDAAAVLKELEAHGGRLEYADRADAAMIEAVYHMSKNQFKRAVGHLYRERKIEIDRKADTIRLLG